MYCQCSLARFGASSRNHGRNDDHSRGAVRPPLRGGRPAAHRGADARSADGIGGAALAGRARRGAAGEQDEREHERAAAGAVGCGGAGDEAGRPARLLPRGGQPARAHAGLAARADEDDARSAVAGGDLLSGPRATGAGPAVLVREILRQHGRGAGSGEAAVVRRKRTAEPGIGRLMELRMPKVSAVRPWTPVALLALLPSAVGAQVQDSAGAVQPLSLEEALERALDQSEEVRLAGARVEAAQARAMSAWSNALPQVNTSLGYTKTLRSVFQTAGDIEIPDSMRFEPDPTAPLEDRVTYLEDRTPAAAFGALATVFSDLPFGNENTWVAGLSLSQPLFAGGRIRSAIQLAEHAEDAAEAAYDEAAADIVLQVRRAYYDAALASATVDIVEASVDLARGHLEDVRLREDAGRA